MGAGKVVLLGAVAAASALLFMHHANASPAPAKSGLPGGWTPPDGAVFRTLPVGPDNPTGVPLDVWRWDNNTGGGAQPGHIVLVVSHNNPQNDFAAFFVPQPTSNTQSPTPALLAAGTTQTSGLIAQAIVAGLVS